MREILFRGKRVDNGGERIAFGNLVISPDGYFIVTARGEFPDTGYVWSKVIPETVGQFTGRHDINRKEVYEGDVVRVIREDSYKPYMAEVYFSGGCYGTTWFDSARKKNTFEPIFSWGIEVIDNIHDNHELIEKEDE